MLVGADTSVFNSKMKEVAEGLRSGFGLNAKQANAVASLELSLRKQVETWGMNTAEAKMYALSQQGVSGAALKSAHSLQQMVYRLQDEKKAADKAKAAQDALFAKGENLTKEVRNGFQKYRDRVKELKQMLDQGAISQAVFNKAANQSSLINKAGMLGAKGLMFVGAAAVVGATALAVYGRSALNAIDEAGDMADSLGITMKAFTQLSHAVEMTGSRSQDLAPALQKMNQNLGDAAMNGGPAADALKRLGLDVQTIAGMKPDEAFKTIAGAFEGIKSPADRASLAMDIFGKGGIRLVNSLSAGKNALNEFSGQADKMGITFTNADKEMAGAAIDSLNNIWGIFSAIGQKIAVGFAPVIVELGTKFMEWAADSVNVGKVVSGSLDLVAHTIAYVVDVLNTFKVMGHTVYAGLIYAASGYLKSLALQGKAIEALINLFPNMNASFTGALDEMTKGLDILANEQWDKAKDAFNNPPGTKVIQWFDKVRAKAEETSKAINKTAEETSNAEKTKGVTAAFNKLKEELQSKIDLFGVNESFASIAKLKKLAGGSLDPKQVAELEKQAATLQGKTLLEKIQTPLEKAKKEMADLRELHDKGGINDEEFAKLKGASLKDAGLDGSIKYSGALEVGSKEARSALLNYNNASQSQLATVASNSKRQVDLLQEIVNINTRTGRVETIRI